MQIGKGIGKLGVRSIKNKRDGGSTGAVGESGKEAR
jgi:hypothetical protein